MLYNREIPTSLADSIGNIFPEKIVRDLTKIRFDLNAEKESDKFAALERAGFRLDREVGMLDCIQGRYGGY